MNPMLLKDFYKADHRSQYPVGTTLVYSNFTPRKSRNPDIKEVVFFGLQYFIKEFLIERFNRDFFNLSREDAVFSYSRIIDNSLGKGAITYDHIGALHDLGYLPIKIKALSEGTKCPIGVPVLTIVNTLPEFFWLTNFLETVLSTSLWGPTTSATTAYQYRKLLDKFAMETVGNTEFVQWQGADFSFRGMWGLEAACMSGAGHLLSFTGTDTIPAISWLEKYYNTYSNQELIGGSVAASEHSTMSVNGPEGEFDIYKRLLTGVYPQGIVSLVSDTYDLWNVITNYLVKLKSDIMARDGKLVIRPDSGDPVEIICGIEIDDLTKEVGHSDDMEVFKSYAMESISERVREETPHGECGPLEESQIFKYNGDCYKVTVEFFWNRHDKQYYYIDGEEVIGCEKISLTPEQKGVIELLWDIFGGTVSLQGYKVLDSHIGAIYGDSITLERAKQICERLKNKGFASTNTVLGIGSFSYTGNSVSRDSLGFAMKATYGEINGEPREIFKDPATDKDKMKKSLKGLLKVYKDNGVIKVKDQCTKQEEGEGLLETVFENGKLLKETSLREIRERVRS